MLNGNDYKLRSLEERDLQLVLEWRNSERIRACMYTDQIITMAEHLAWYERLNKSQNIVYKIFEYQDVPAGVINFSDYDERNNRWSWGFYLGREDLPRGSGTVMGQLGLKIAFEHLKARKLQGECFASNSDSIKFHKRLGFEEEGSFKKHIYKNGNYQDIIIFALFNDDYMRRNATNADH